VRPGDVFRGRGRLLVGCRLRLRRGLSLRRFLRFRLLGRLRGAIRSFFQHRENLANLHVRPFLVLDGRQDARPIGAHFQIDLFRFEFHKWIAGINAVALLLQPLGNARFDNGFAQLRDDDVGRHDVTRYCGRDNGAAVR